MEPVRAITGCVHEWTHTTFPDGGVRLACLRCAGREFIPPPPAGRSVVAYPEPVLAVLPYTHSHPTHLDMGGRCGVCFQWAVQSPCPTCVRGNAAARRHEGWDPPLPALVRMPPKAPKEGDE